MFVFSEIGYAMFQKVKNLNKYVQYIEPAVYF